jgi:hypothetical protein
MRQYLTTDNAAIHLGLQTKQLGGEINNVTYRNGRQLNPVRALRFYLVDLIIVSDIKNFSGYYLWVWVVTIIGGERNLRMAKVKQ